MRITNLFLVTNEWLFKNQLPKDDSPIGDQNPIPLSIQSFNVGLMNGTLSGTLRRRASTDMPARGARLLPTASAMSTQAWIVNLREYGQHRINQVTMSKHMAMCRTRFQRF